MNKALNLLNGILPAWPVNWPAAVLTSFLVLVGSSLAGGVTLLLLPMAPQPLLANIVAGVVAWFCLWHDERKWTRFISAYGAGAFCFGWGLYFGNDKLVISTLWGDSSLIMLLGVVLVFTSPSKLADELE